MRLARCGFKPGYWILDTGCALRVTDLKLDIRYWVLGIGYWSIDNQQSSIDNPEGVFSIINDDSSIQASSMVKISV